MISEGLETNEQIERIDTALQEPNPGDRRRLTENLREANFTNGIHDVANGEAALDFRYQRDDYVDSSRPDRILLEPRLPDIDGMESLSKPEEGRDVIGIVQAVVDYWRTLVQKASADDCEFSTELRLRFHPI